MEKQLVIKDKIYGDILLDGIYKDLVECQDFKRLEDIHQTGTSIYEFEGMEEENRYEHSIGSYHLMCRVINNIEKKLGKSAIKVNNEEKEIAKIAMLLHDIGHASFSHTLENITGLSHEKMTIEIVKSKETQINKIITEYYGEGFAKKVADFLEYIYDEDRPVEEIKINNGEVNLKGLLASLSSNNIDCDRLDFIHRDSAYADFTIVTDTYKLIDAFEYVYDGEKIVVAIPMKDKHLADAALYERARNYEKIYYCYNSVIGDHTLETLFEELKDNPEEIPEYTDDVIKRLLKREDTNFTVTEYMKLRETPINEVIAKIGENTENEKIKYLCNQGQVIRDFESLSTDEDEEYIRYLLNKAIPEISINTKGLIDETRLIKPYKSNKTECINVITNEGIEDYENIDSSINTKPIRKRVTAINLEMIRLELGVSKKEFNEKYKRTIEEVISTVTKPKEKLELRYVVKDTDVSLSGIREKIKQEYEVIGETIYSSTDVYYDDPDKYELLLNRETLRIREGATFDKGEEIYGFKKTRIAHKKYKECKNKDKDSKKGYTNRIENEKIGESTDLEDYESFTDKNGIDIKNLSKVMNINSLVCLYTLNVNGQLVDVSFNMAIYENQIYKTKGRIGNIEINPRDNNHNAKIALAPLRAFLEKEIPKLDKKISTENIYEIAVNDTYKKAKRKGAIIKVDKLEEFGEIKKHGKVNQEGHEIE